MFAKILQQKKAAPPNDGATSSRDYYQQDSELLLQWPSTSLCGKEQLQYSTAPTPCQ